MSLLILEVKTTGHLSQSKVQCPKSNVTKKVQCPKSNVQSPTSKVRCSKFEVQTNKGALNTNCRTLDFGPWTLDSIWDVGRWTVYSPPCRRKRSRGLLKLV